MANKTRDVSNAETLRAIEECENRECKSFETIEEFFEDLDVE